MPADAQRWIDSLKLQPHPEGGFFREIYRSEGMIPPASLPVRYGGGRSFSTTIFYLLESGDFSSLHRLKSDEQWFFIDGSPLTIHSIDPTGLYSHVTIGKDLARGESPHAVVYHGNWFGAKVEGRGSFSLTGCIVAPGFDFEDFELAEKTGLCRPFPQHTVLIEKLTRR